MSGDEIVQRLTSVFVRWETTPDLLEIWRKAMSQFADVPDAMVEKIVGEHLYERGALPEPVLRTVVDKLAATQPRTRGIPIPIADEQERQRRHEEKFGAVEKRRREDERRLKELSGEEFEALRQQALAALRVNCPAYLDHTIRKHGEDPFANATIFNAMAAEMGAAAK